MATHVTAFVQNGKHQANIILHNYIKYQIYRILQLWSQRIAHLCSVLMFHKNDHPLNPSRPCPVLNMTDIYIYRQIWCDDVRLGNCIHTYLDIAVFESSWIFKQSLSCSVSSSNFQGLVVAISRQTFYRQPIWTWIIRSFWDDAMMPFMNFTTIEFVKGLLEKSCVQTEI